MANSKRTRSRKRSVGGQNQNLMNPNLMDYLMKGGRRGTRTHRINRRRRTGGSCVLDGEGVQRCPNGMELPA
jgi:hypothetical protein